MWCLHLVQLRIRKVILDILRLLHPSIRLSQLRGVNSRQCFVQQQVGGHGRRCKRVALGIQLQCRSHAFAHLAFPRRFPRDFFSNGVSKSRWRCNRFFNVKVDFWWPFGGNACKIEQWFSLRRCRSCPRNGASLPSKSSSL